MERLPGRVRVANKFFVAWLFLTIICFCGFCLMIRPKGQRGLGIVKKLSPMSARLGGGRRHLAVYFDTTYKRVLCFGAQECDSLLYKVIGINRLRLVVTRPAILRRQPQSVPGGEEPLVR